MRTGRLLRRLRQQPPNYLRQPQRRRAVKGGEAGAKRVPCVSSMFDSWRGESPRANLMEVKDSEAQGLPSRGGV